MTWADVRSVLLGAFGALLVWMLGYTGKHTLDRLVLPKVLDWLAQRNRDSAATRAKNIIQLFELNVRRASDIKTMILVSESRLAFLILSTCAINYMITFYVLLDVGEPTEQIASRLYIKSLLVVPPLLMVFCFYIIKYIRSEMDDLEDLHKYRVKTLARLRKLLTGAHFTEGQIEEWLSRVPQIP
jgi:hypothetical protein